MAWSTTRPTLYRSTARLMVEPQVVTLRGVGGNVTLSITSPDRRTIQSLAFAPEQLESVTSSLGEDWNLDAERFRSRMSIDATNNETFSLTARHRNPERAQQLAEAWTRAVVDGVQREYFSYTEPLERFEGLRAEAEARVEALLSSEQVAQRVQESRELSLRGHAWVEAMAAAEATGQSTEALEAELARITTRVAELNQQDALFQQELDRAQRELQQYQTWAMSWDQIRPVGSIIKVVGEPALPTAPEPARHVVHAGLGAVIGLLLGLGLVLLRGPSHSDATTPVEEPDSGVWSPPRDAA